jgi:hypothetical protein
MIEVFIPDIPNAVTVQLARQKLFVDAIFHNITPDDGAAANVSVTRSVLNELKDTASNRGLQSLPIVVFYCNVNCDECESNMLKYEETAKKCDRKAYFYTYSLDEIDKIVHKTVDFEFVLSEIGCTAGKPATHSLTHSLTHSVPKKKYPRKKFQL